jgi:putative endonuclease
MAYYVYLLASRKDGPLYLGVTNDLIRRTFEHRSKITRGFTSRYNITKLVWFEIYEDPISAISREKEIKKMAAFMEGRFDCKGKSRLE